MAICAKKLTFTKFFSQGIPTLISYITENKIFFSRIFMVELKCRLVPVPSAMRTFPAKIFDSSGFRTVSSYSRIARPAAESVFVLGVGKSLFANLANSHGSSIS